MSGGTPAQNLTLTLVIGVLVVAIALWIVVGRVRRTRATGSAESGSVRTRGQAKEIADRIHAYCSGDTAGSTTDGPRVEVLGAARLQAALRADDRFEVSAQGEREGYWSFRVPSGRAEAQGIADILGRNGVTAVAPSST